MFMQEMNETASVLGALFLNGLLNTTLLDITAQQAKPLSQQEIVKAMKDIVMQMENTPAFNHLQFRLGGKDMNIFIVISAENTVSSQPSQTNKAPQPLSIQPLQPPLSHDMIHKGVSQIFQHKHFRKDSIMANNPLHNLTIVKQEYQALIRKRKLAPSALSEYHKASFLRKFLTNCVDEELCPLMNTIRPQEFSKSALEVQQKLTEYLILRWQYIDGQPREDVQKILGTEYDCWVSGGTYGRYLKGARKRLSSVIWQKEMGALTMMG